MQGCRSALEDRIVLFGSVAGGIGFVFGVLEVGSYYVSQYGDDLWLHYITRTWRFN